MSSIMFHIIPPCQWSGANRGVNITRPQRVERNVPWRVLPELAALEAWERSGTDDGWPTQGLFIAGGPGRGADRRFGTF